MKELARMLISIIPGRPRGIQSLSLLVITGALFNGSVAFALKSPLEVAKERFSGAGFWLYNMAVGCFQEDEQCGIQGTREFVIVNGITWEYGRSHSHSKISFDSEKRHPGTFLIDGNVRIAKTGSVWGAPIVINEDLIVIPDGIGGMRPISLLEAAAVLLHEYGHHQGEDPYLEGVVPKCEELDRLASKARSLMEAKSRKILISKQVHPGIREPFPTVIQLYDVDSQDGMIVDGPHGTRFTLISIETFQGTLNVSETVANLAKCPSVPTEGALDYGGYPVYAFLKRISNTEIVSVENGVKVRLTVPEAGMVCAKHENNTYWPTPGYRDGLLEMYFGINAEGLLEFSRELSSFNITLPPP